MEFYCVQEWIATKILPDLLKGGDKLMANVKLLIIVSICGLALYLINKAIVWILDLEFKADRAVKKIQIIEMNKDDVKIKKTTYISTVLINSVRSQI